MRKHWLRGSIVLAALGLFGCGSSPDPDVSDDTRLATSVDYNVGDWLDRSRADLADDARIKSDALDATQKAHRTNKEPAELLPDLRPALSPPVFRTAAYSKKLGFSLPPYVAEDVKDRELAWHLARFGDIEAAK